MDNYKDSHLSWNGSLTLDDGLALGKLTVPFFDAEVEIDLAVVVGERTAATPDQLASISQYLDRHSEVLFLANRAIMEEYLRTVEQYRAFALELGENPDSLAPYISSPDQLRGLIQLQELYIPYSGRIGSFGLSYWCKWEVEHGLGLAFDGWNVSKIGDASVTSDCGRE